MNKEEKKFTRLKNVIRLSKRLKKYRLRMVAAVGAGVDVVRILADLLGELRRQLHEAPLAGVALDRHQRRTQREAQGIDILVRLKSLSEREKQVLERCVFVVAFVGERKRPME